VKCAVFDQEEEKQLLQVLELWFLYPKDHEAKLVEWEYPRPPLFCWKELLLRLSGALLETRLACRSSYSMHESSKKFLLIGHGG